MEEAQEQQLSNAEVLSALQRQNTLLENIQKSLENTNSNTISVRFENFNIPFFDMVGLILK